MTLRRNIKLTLEYDGTDFFGWQRQPNVRTVQAEVEHALSELTQETIKTTVAGRTDTGVHALGQVVNFKTHSDLPTDVFVKGGNAILPKDVRVIAAEEVDSNFNARFSARARSYRYRISKKPRAIGRQYSWYLMHKVNFGLMQEACPLILGEKDFQSFCQAGTDVPHFRCVVHSATWTETEDYYIFDISANRFLHNMVRILVGTFLEIGSKRVRPEEIEEILEARDRRMAGPTVPAQGLFLVRVDYHSDN